MKNAFISKTKKPKNTCCFYEVVATKQRCTEQCLITDVHPNTNLRWHIHGGLTLGKGSPAGMFLHNKKTKLHPHNQEASIVSSSNQKQKSRLGTAVLMVQHEFGGGRLS